MLYFKCLVISALLALVCACASLAQAQTDTPSCAESLVPCASFMNSTNPPASCCGPLKEAIDTQLKCLCDIYNTPGLLKSLGININDALLMPSRCKISGELSDCVKGSGPTSSQSPPATPGKDNSGVSRISGALMLSTLLFCAYVMLYY